MAPEFNIILSSRTHMKLLLYADLNQCIKLSKKATLSLWIANLILCLRTSTLHFVYRGFKCTTSVSTLNISSTWSRRTAGFDSKGHNVVKNFFFLVSIQHFFCHPIFATSPLFFQRITNVAVDKLFYTRYIPQLVPSIPRFKCNSIKYILVF